MADEGASRGIVVTYGSFTNDATAFADRNAITLVAGSELMPMIRSVQSPQAKMTGGDNTRRAAATDRENSVSPESPQSVSAPSSPPSCPICDAEMVQRTARRGECSGKPFWGCRRYPRCNGIRQIPAE